MRQGKWCFHSKIHLRSRQWCWSCQSDDILPILGKEWYPIIEKVRSMFFICHKGRSPEQHVPVTVSPYCVDMLIWEREGNRSARRKTLEAQCLLTRSVTPFFSYIFAFPYALRATSESKTKLISTTHIYYKFFYFLRMLSKKLVKWQRWRYFREKAAY